MFVRAWKKFGGHEDISQANTAEVHFNDGRVVQITCADEGDSRGNGIVLLRAWPAKGTHEYGGNNLDDFSLVLKITDEECTVESIRYDREISHWHRERNEKND